MPVEQYATKIDGPFRTTLVDAHVHGQRRVESLTANRTLTESDSGTLFLCNKAASLAITLPALAGVDVGTTYEFVVQTAVSGGDMTITAATGDLLAGKVTNYDTDTSNAVTFYSPDGTDDLIATLNGSTKGGVGWDRLIFVATTANQWLVTGTVYATGTPATLFS